MPLLRELAATRSIRRVKPPSIPSRYKATHGSFLQRKVGAARPVVSKAVASVRKPLAAKLHKASIIASHALKRARVGVKSLRRTVKQSFHAVGQDVNRWAMGGKFRRS